MVGIGLKSFLFLAGEVLNETFIQEVYCHGSKSGDLLFMLYIGTSSATSSPLKKEQPLFTLRQVGMICERLLKEREEKVREEYEEILNTKLAGNQ